MIPAIKGSPGVSLEAVASRSKEKAVAFAEQFACRAVTGYQTILDDDLIDAVYIPLPTGLHEEWVEKAIEAGKHVLVEKSFVTSYDAALRLIGLAREKKLIIIENFLFPLHSQFNWIRAKLQDGIIGELKLLRATFSFPAFDAGNIRNKSELGGGALFDAGAYVLKISSLILGDDLDLIGATTEFNQDFGVDFAGSGILRNSKGQVAQVAFGFGLFYQCNLELLGTEGKISAGRIYTSKSDFAPEIVVETKSGREVFSLPTDDQYGNMIPHFKELLAGGSYDNSYNELLLQARLMDTFKNAAE